MTETQSDSMRGVRAFVLVLAALALVGCARSRASDSRSQKTISARIVSVELRKVQRNVEGVGSLFPFEEVAVSSEVEGRVARVFVDVGDRVKLGSPLVKVAPAELDLALDHEAAAYEQVRARLGLAEGEELKDLGEAAEVKRAAADRTDGEQKYLRAKSLFEDGLLSRGSFDEAETHYNSTKAAYDMAVQSVGDLKAQIGQRRASMAVAQKKVADSVIRAPFAGLVKERSVSTGQYLKVQTTVMLIVNSDPLRVRLKVPEKMAAWVAVGQPVKVTVEAFPGRVFEGKLARVNPSVDPQTRSLEVEAFLDNQEGLLKPGFFARATIVSNQVDTALVVPQGALRYVYGVYKVFKVENQSLKETEVKLGERTGDDVEIVQGLAEHNKVAVQVTDELRDGAAVAPLQQP